jgi:eukaryotic-like serine/threonine-protein kinase
MILEASARYRIVRKLGEGGMGVVYAAHDDRLDRPVAIKRIRPGLTSGQDRQRFWREARAAASVSHPNVCQLYEIDEDRDGLFLAMEFLEGEPLSGRLARGPLLAGEAIQIALAVLSALAALHQKGIVHRDLKPSNIFLSAHGVKLLDFGLARPSVGGVAASDSDLTLPGVILGTPRYMAPEMIEGRVADARSDLFVLGIVLYEMLAGSPPFRGGSVIEIGRAILQDEPPALGGSPGVVGLDRIVHRALRKPVDERYQTADTFAQDLRSTLLGTDTADVSRVRPMSRLVVLPFRLLRPDPSIDFLAFSLADAISSALSGLPSLVVRSTAAASRFADDRPDIPALAGALGVDVVLLGTLLSSGGQVRVTAQLVQTPSGTLLRSMTAQSTSGEIFELQDSLAKSIVESLSLSLTTPAEGAMGRDAPADAEAYESYLRANRMQLDSRQWAAARDLYLRCLERDPRFAPAWARLGRCYRLLGKYDDPSQAEANLALGEEALKRALEINPDLSLAHNLYAHVEVDTGRAREATVRLLERVRRTASQPDLFAGLVQACRYCGLLDASVAAYERARSLDPGVITSAAQTFFLQGEWDRAMAADRSDPPFTKASALVQLGRGAEGLELLRAGVARGLHPQLHDLANGMIAALEGRHDEVIRLTHRVLDSGFGDHEVFYHWAGALAQAGDHDGALGLLERSIVGGFHPASALARDPRFDPVRATADFRQILRRADELQREALEAFRAADGPRLLGLPQV